MKRYFKLFLSLSLVAIISSCISMVENAQDVPMVEKIEVSYKVAATTSFQEKGGEVIPDPNFSANGLLVEFVNLNTSGIVSTKTDDEGIATVNLIPGDYSIRVSGKVENDGFTYMMNGTIPQVSLIKTITREEAKSSSSIVIRPAKLAPLIISEIYYCGASNYYFRDQTYHIYNNGDEVEYLDGLCFAQLHPNIASASSTPPIWPDEDGIDNYVYGLVVWQFPGNGTDYPLAPGESVVLAQEARDHTVNNPDSYDNSMANWECWSGNASRNNPDVADLPPIFTRNLNKTQWLTSVFGAAFCLYRPDDGTVINTEYYEDYTNLQTEVNKTTYYSKIPAGWIYDGVELLGDMSLLSKKRIPGFVDAGGTSVEQTYCQKVVSRKVVGRRADGTPLFADTNNSTEDFEVIFRPEIRRHGSKAPAWDGTNK
ncbi:MAG: DUF4876 domain-containing protein [Bacteroidales bacterium]|nr:DUF4876 domain-containing protein [Bacteroidales bacterium]